MPRSYGFPAKRPFPAALVTITAPIRSPKISSASRPPASAAPLPPGSPAARIRRANPRLRRQSAPTDVGALVTAVRVAGSARPALPIHEVYRNVKHDGAPLDLRAAEGAGGVFGSRFGGTDLLGDRTGGRGERRLIHLKVRPERAGRRVSGEQHQRCSALGGFGQPGQRVREARPLVDARHADLTRNSRVTVSHRNGGALVTGGVELGPGVTQRVHNGKVATADEAEERIDPVPGQGICYRFGYFHGFVSGLVRLHRGTNLRVARGFVQRYASIEPFVEPFGRACIVGSAC